MSGKTSLHTPLIVETLPVWIKLVLKRLLRMELVCLTLEDISLRLVYHLILLHLRSIKLIVHLLHLREWWSKHLIILKPLCLILLGDHTRLKIGRRKICLRSLLNNLLRNLCMYLLLLNARYIHALFHGLIRIYGTWIRVEVNIISLIILHCHIIIQHMMLILSIDISIFWWWVTRKVDHVILCRTDTRISTNHIERLLLKVKSLRLREHILLLKLI